MRIFYFPWAVLCGICLCSTSCERNPESGAGKAVPARPERPRGPIQGGEEMEEGDLVAPVKGSSLDVFIGKCAGIRRDHLKDGRIDPAQRARVLEMVAAAANGLSDGDLRSLLLDIKSCGLRDEALVELVQTGAASVLATRSAGEFLKFVEENRAALVDVSSLAGGIKVVADREPGRLVGWLEKDLAENWEENSNQMSSLCAAALGVMAQECPRELLAMLQRVKFPWDTEGFLSLIARDNPEVLKAFIDSAPGESKFLSASIHALAGECQERDPDQAIELIGRLGTGPWATAAAAEFVHDWLRMDPNQAGAYAMRLSPEVLFAVMSQKAINSEALVKAHPELVERLVNGVVITSANSNRIRDLVDAAAEVAPEMALGWVKAMDRTPFSKDLLKSTIEQLVISQGPDADPLKYLPAMGEEGRGEVLAGIAGAVGDRNGATGKLGDLLAMGEKLPAEERGGFLEVALSRASIHDPAVVMKLMEEEAGIGLGDEQMATVMGKASVVWGHRNPAEASAWIETQREGAGKTAFVQGMVKGWIDNNPVAASDWLANQSPGPARDAGIMVLVASLEQTDPERASQWRELVAKP